MANEVREVVGFQNYLLTSEGEVINRDTGSQRRAFANEQGIACVTLFREGRPYTRSLPLLMARTFLPVENDHFNSVIQLDYDRMNCALSNLARRPRWFVVEYYKQRQKAYYDVPVSIWLPASGEVFHKMSEPAEKYGLLVRHILASYTNEQSCFPTGQEFRFYEEGNI